jgi:hypothetical protein
MQSKSNTDLYFDNFIEVSKFKKKIILTKCSIYFFIKAENDEVNDLQNKKSLTRVSLNIN